MRRASRTTVRARTVKALSTGPRAGKSNALDVTATRRRPVSQAASAIASADLQ